MEQLYRNRILRNLDYLTNSTCSIITLCVNLVSKECLSINEFQIVRAQVSDEQKCLELFTRLMQKPNAFDHLLYSLEDSGNEHVARKLKQPINEELLELSSPLKSLKTYDQNEDNRLKSKVLNEHLVWVEDILCRIDCNYWNNFMRQLLRFDTKIINDIERMCRTEPHSEFVHKTLSAWITVQGDAATIENLIKSLNDSHLNYVSESLKKQFSNMHQERPACA